MENFAKIVDDIAYVKYTNTGLKTLLANLLPPNTTLGQRPNHDPVTTFQLDDSQASWAPITISNLPNDPSSTTYPVDAGMSTAAAPTYFPPYDHPTFGYCVDGGVFANNRDR